jgi:hypothetical protein
MFSYLVVILKYDIPPCLIISINDNTTLISTVSALYQVKNKWVIFQSYVLPMHSFQHNRKRNLRNEVFPFIIIMIKYSKNCNPIGR